MRFVHLLFPQALGESKREAGRDQRVALAEKWRAQPGAGGSPPFGTPFRFGLASRNERAKRHQTKSSGEKTDSQA